MAGKRPKRPPSAPMWLATFADLCTLLLCFFVLMLSTATQDVKKFKQVAGSMKQAFGVQNEIAAPDSPMGTSFIAQEFSPAQTEPTIIDEIRQTAVRQAMETKLMEVAEETGRIRALLKEEIKQGQIMVETVGLSIIIRIQEKGSFASGSADLQPEFLSVMDKITLAVIEAKGKVQVSGHTDDVPIANIRYRSNWDLSASRAVTVAQKMMDNKDIDPARIVVQGYADTQLLVKNNSAENRARNRRVEVVIAADTPISGP